MSKSTIFVLACFFLVTVTSRNAPETMTQLTPTQICINNGYQDACKKQIREDYCGILFCWNSTREPKNVFGIGFAPDRTWCDKNRECQNKACVDGHQQSTTFDFESLQNCGWVYAQYLHNRSRTYN